MLEPIIFEEPFISKDGRATQYFQLWLSNFAQKVVEQAALAAVKSLAESAAMAPASGMSDDIRMLLGDSPQASDNLDILRTILNNEHAAPSAEAKAPWLAASIAPAGKITPIIRDMAANLSIYPAAAYPDAIYFETDTFIIRTSSGAAWVEQVLPALAKFFGLTSSFPALKRSTVGLIARLADDSANTWVKGLINAYGGGWDGSDKFTTEDAVFDKIEAVEVEIAAKADSVSPALTPGTYISGARLTPLGSDGSITVTAQGTVSAISAAT